MALDASLAGLTFIHLVTATVSAGKLRFQMYIRDEDSLVSASGNVYNMADAPPPQRIQIRIPGFAWIARVQTWIGTPIPNCLFKTFRMFLLKIAEKRLFESGGWAKRSAFVCCLCYKSGVLVAHRHMYLSFWTLWVKNTPESTNVFA